MFTRIAANAGGNAYDQALAYFLPGILYSLGYTLVFGTSSLFGWPLVGFMVGSVTATRWPGTRTSRWSSSAPG